MTLPIEIINMIECCLNNDGHFVKEAILLPCGANACKKCLHELFRKDFKCFKCQKMHKNDDIAKQYHNPALDVLVEKVYLKDIIQSIKSGFNDALKKIEDVKFDEKIEKNFENIEFEIDIKIESLKNQIDNIREVLKDKLKELKHKISTNTTDRLHNMKKSIVSTQRKFYLNSENFREYQQKLYEYKREIDSFTKNVPQMVFECAEIELEDKLAGKLIEKHSFKYENVKFIKSVKIPHAKFMTNLAFSNIDNQILITDNEESILRSIDLKGKHLKTCGLTTGSKPATFCTNANGDFVYVANIERRKIEVYKNTNFEYLTEFGDSNIKKPDSMNIDHETNLLYITEYDSNYVSVWSLDDQKYQTQIKIDSPAQIQIVDDKIFVISESDFEHVKTTGRIRITKGSNSIFIINKLTNEIENKIKLDDWFDPCGLCVDNNQNILTTAFELDKDKYVSQKRFLYIFDRYFKQIKKFPLDFDYFTDMLLNERKIFFCTYDNLRIVEFD